MKKLPDFIALIAAILMSVSGFILIRNNYPSFHPSLPALLLWTVYFALFPVLGFLLVFKRVSESDTGTAGVRIVPILLFPAGVVVLLLLFFRGAVTDYYQPFSLYDAPIYIMLVAWVLFIGLFLQQAVRGLINRPVGRHLLIWPLLLMLLPAVIPAFRGISRPEWTASVSEAHVLFEGGSEGYRSYRIPGLLAVPAGSELTDGHVLEDDLVLAFAEARREGSLDQGDIDLVMRRSIDGGHSWEPAVVVRTWEEGLGKIGDPTPLFDSARGRIILAHGAQAHGTPYETWLMESGDGGLTWSPPVHLGDGSPGPGHGAAIVGGAYDGRLLLPAHKGNNGFAWISDTGDSWRRSESGYTGNESLVAPLGDGRMVYTARVPRSVAKPHPPMVKLFGMSEDGGDSWRPYPASEVTTPICMAGFHGSGDGNLWFVNPATTRTRARLSLRSSGDGGLSWSDAELLFPGPAGYADLTSTSDGTLLVLAENGRVEYDERITLVRIPR